MTIIVLTEWKEVPVNGSAKNGNDRISKII